MIPLFDNKNILDIDIIALQEPWRNIRDQTTYHPRKDVFHLVYPENDKARVCFFINKKIDQSTWTYTVHSADMISLHITLSGRELHIHNVYNPVNIEEVSTSIPLLKQILAKNPHKEHIALGDFNLHHELWGGPNTPKTHTEKAEELIIVTQRYGMEQLVSTGTITYKESTGENTIDLVFATGLLSESLISCGIAEQFDHDSDHQPIFSHWFLETVSRPCDFRRQLTKIDTTLMIKTLKKNLAYISYTFATTAQELDEKVSLLIKTIEIAIDASIPLSRLCSKSVPRFDESCKDAQMKARRPKKIWKKEEKEESWEEFRQARAEKGRIIAKAKKKAYQESRAKACTSSEDLWKAVKQTNYTLRQPCLPNIQKSTRGLATEPKEKIEELTKVLLPTPQSADLSDIQDYIYPEGLPMPKITQSEIMRSISQLKARKAPGPDQIPNEVLKLISGEIVNYLELIFNDSLELGHYPLHFKESVVVILRKHGGNRDYTSPKNYWPISLLNTIGKIMEAILATRISFMATAHSLLPTSHFGGRRGSCIETAIHNLLEKIYAAWNKDEIASLLMLDVSAAYPNTSHKRLLHNLRKRKIDHKVVKWVKSFLGDWHTIVKTNKYTTSKLLIELGLPQGSPLSSILYLFYNADLLEDSAKKGVEAQGFIDDIILIATGKSTKGNNQKLARVHKDVCENWRLKHGSEFSLSKYQLIYFSRKRGINYLAGIRLEEGHIV